MLEYDEDVTGLELDEEIVNPAGSSWIQLDKIQLDLCYCFGAILYYIPRTILSFVYDRNSEMRNDRNLECRNDRNSEGNGILCICQTI